MHYLFILHRGQYELRKSRGATTVGLDNGKYCFGPSRDVAFVDFWYFGMRNKSPEGSQDFENG
jgi:hypothetical protein